MQEKQTDLLIAPTSKFPVLFNKVKSFSY